MSKNRNALDGKIHQIRQGVAIYKINASPFYRVRIWIPSQKKRIVKTTKTAVRAEAIQIAEELFASMGSKGQLSETPKEFTFEHFAEKLIVEDKKNGEKGEINSKQSTNTKNLMHNPTWGIATYFKRQDVRPLRTKEFNAYMDWVNIQDPNLSIGTRNHISVAFRRVMKLAHRKGAIDAVPETPRLKAKDNPRSFFRFAPLAKKTDDEYQLLLTTTRAVIAEKKRIRGSTTTSELYDFIEFMTHTFLRPTGGEIYALRHRDITVATNPKRLIMTVRQGKTGHRMSNSLPEAVEIYDRICKRYKAHSPEDFIFLPKFDNRSHASRIVQNQFNFVLKRCGLKNDPVTDVERTVYSLRHTAICMRLILSEGKVNIFNLAKNAGTSVQQIERFYARNLPLSAEMARNLHSFGD